jgi:hypothetical protein
MDLLDRHPYGYRNKVAAGESRHHEMTGPLAGAMREAAAGYLDAKLAADTLESVFLEVVAQPPISSKQGKSRTGNVAKDEWQGLLAWAVGQAQDADPDETRERINKKFPPPYTEISEPPEALAALNTDLRTWQDLPETTHVVVALAAAATRNAEVNPAGCSSSRPHPQANRRRPHPRQHHRRPPRRSKPPPAYSAGAKAKTYAPQVSWPESAKKRSSPSVTCPASPPPPTEAAATKCSVCCDAPTTDLSPATSHRPDE